MEDRSNEIKKTDASPHSDKISENKPGYNTETDKPTGEIQSTDVVKRPIPDPKKNPGK